MLSFHFGPRHWIDGPRWWVASGFGAIIDVARAEAWRKDVFTVTWWVWLPLRVLIGILILTISLPLFVLFFPAWSAWYWYFGQPESNHDKWHKVTWFQSREYSLWVNGKRTLSKRQSVVLTRVGNNRYRVQWVPIMSWNFGDFPGELIHEVDGDFRLVRKAWHGLHADYEKIAEPDSARQAEKCAPLPWSQGTIFKNFLVK